LLTSEFVRRVLDPRYLVDLSERDPEGTLALLQTIRELSDTQLVESHGKRLHIGFFKRFLERPHLFREMNRNPELAFAWLALLLDLGGEDIVPRAGVNFVDDAFDPIFLKQLLKRKPATFAVALRLSRMIKSRQATGALIETLASSLRDSGIKRSLLPSLPIEALPDLRWLAEETGQPDLAAALTLLHGN
ncbi:MAG TPA: hypothetical protein VN724_18105, partial [Pyrinomonadaceae bacterium]|nr:hypothetical protein [Pyrinomonadaceae bacterium]